MLRKCRGNVKIAETQGGEEVIAMTQERNVTQSRKGAALRRWSSEAETTLRDRGRGRYWRFVTGMRTAYEASFAISCTVFGDDILLCDFAPLGLCVGFFPPLNLEASTLLICCRGITAKRRINWTRVLRQAAASRRRHLFPHAGQTRRERAHGTRHRRQSLYRNRGECAEHGGEYFREAGVSRFTPTKSSDQRTSI